MPLYLNILGPLRQRGRHTSLVLVRILRIEPLIPWVMTVHGGVVNTTFNVFHVHDVFSEHFLQCLRIVSA